MWGLCWKAFPHTECGTRIENPVIGEQRHCPRSWVRLPGISSLVPGIGGDIVFADVGVPVDGAYIFGSGERI